MGNMSYCRFQNTSKDLDDCQSALEELIDGTEDCPLSREELAAAKRLAATCLNIVELLAEYSERDLEDVTEDNLGEAIDDIQHVIERQTSEEGDE